MWNLESEIWNLEFNPMTSAEKTVLIVGGGGREHALAWKIAQDSCRPRIFCAPGNAGTATLGTNLSIAASDVPGLLKWAVAHRPSLTVVGPEVPLCTGLVDEFKRQGLRAFGPGAEAARLEGSKIFCKEILQAAGVPTAEARSFTDFNEARDYIRGKGGPLVVKADGLASGKGVAVCTTPEDALRAAEDILVNRSFGDAGYRLLVEEFLEGEEASVLALIDGEHVVLLASAQDHKRANDGDTGPNTGGMGAYSPAPVVTPDLLPVIREQVFERTLRELAKRGIEYKGVLYAGLMLTAKGPRVLEYNCRFGDPETQAILPRWDGDLIPALEACIDGNLSEQHVRWKAGSSACVVMAAGGYPGPHETGDVITGLETTAGALVFHAGTSLQKNRVVTAGGRVLAVTGLGPTLRDAVSRAYETVGAIHFKNAHYRKDIGWRALR